MARTRSTDNPPISHHEVKNSKPQAHKYLFKKLKRSKLHPQAPFPFTDLIPDAQHMILKFCDVSTLGDLGCCSKNTCKMTREDKIWEERLKQLFERRYDRVFLQIGISGPPKLDEDKHPLKLSMWPLRSTSLAAWFHSWVLGFWNLADNEHRPDDDSEMEEDMMLHYFHTVGLAHNNPLMHSSIFYLLMVVTLDEISDEDRANPKYQWLFENVPLWAYYNHAESAFKEGQTMLDDMEEDFCEQTNRCIDCYEKLWACECGGGGDSVSTFDSCDGFSDVSVNDFDSSDDSCNGGSNDDVMYDSTDDLSDDCKGA